LAYAVEFVSYSLSATKNVAGKAILVTDYNPDNYLSILDPSSAFKADL
jgi:hypothetical protein